MNQQVNLYQPSRLQEKRPRSLQIIAAVVVFWALCLATHGGLVIMQTRILDSQVRDLDTRRDEIVAAITLMQQQPARTKSVLLEKEVARVRGELEAKRPLLELFRTRSLRSAEGFSPLLAGLSSHTPRGVWFRNLVFASEGGQTVLEGSALSPELVPRLLQDLKKAQVFSGMVFRSFRLSRPEAPGERVDFTLETEAEAHP